MNEYQLIHGQAYKKSLLEIANNKRANTEEPELDNETVKMLFLDALDNGFITNIEINTLQYILQNFAFHADAKAWLAQVVARETPTQRSIQRTLWEGAGLHGIDWSIADEAVTKQQKLGKVKFLNALYAITQSFIYGMESSTSPRDILSLEKNMDLEDITKITNTLQSMMRKGKIYLLPENYLALIENGELDLGVPEFTQDFEEFWTFVLYLPDLSTWNFIGFVNRNDQYDTYNTGYQVLTKR